MFIISKTIKGNEYLYSKKHSILCRSKVQAEKLANFLNTHNDTALDTFKLKNNEIWYTYQIDDFDAPPRYKLKTTKNAIKIVSI